MASYKHVLGSYCYDRELLFLTIQLESSDDTDQKPPQKVARLHEPNGAQVVARPRKPDKSSDKNQSLKAACGQCSGCKLTTNCGKCNFCQVYVVNMYSQHRYATLSLKSFQSYSLCI